MVVVWLIHKRCPECCGGLAGLPLKKVSLYVFRSGSPSRDTYSGRTAYRVSKTRIGEIDLKERPGGALFSLGVKRRRALSRPLRLDVSKGLEETVEHLFAGTRPVHGGEAEVLRP